MNHTPASRFAARRLTLAAICLLSSQALAQSPAQSPAQSSAPPAPAGGYPAQSITLVSPFPPGGGNDNIARLLAAELSSRIGQSVVVDNRGGAGGNLGTSLVARAKPDGYTLVLSQNSVMAVNPAVYKNVGFDPTRDFIPISQITTAPLAMVVAQDSPYKSLDDYLAAARQKPGQITYGSPGNGTLSHLAGVLLSQKKSVTLNHIPYRGASPAVNDLLGGSIDLLITSPSSVEVMLSSGKLRVLAITSPSNIGAFKAAPTLEKLGIADMAIAGWYGVFAPAGTPKDRVAYLAAALQNMKNTPAVIEKIRFDGADAVFSDPDAFARQLQQEITTWAAVVKAANLRID